MTFKIAEKILNKENVVRKQVKTLEKRPNKQSHVDPPKKSTLRDLPTDILVHHLGPLLHSPDLICLALTCKELASKVLVAQPSVDDDVPIIIVQTYGYGNVIEGNSHSGHQFEKDTSFLYLTSRKQLLFQLKDYFPRNFRLCWVCNRYSRVAASKWHSAILSNWRTEPRSEHHYLVRSMFPRRVSCHQECKPSASADALRKWIDKTPGTNWFNTDYHAAQLDRVYRPRTPAPSNSYVLYHVENAMAHYVDENGVKSNERQFFEKRGGSWVRLSANAPVWEAPW